MNFTNKNTSFKWCNGICFYGIIFGIFYSIVFTVRVNIPIRQGDEHVPIIKIQKVYINCAVIIEKIMIKIFYVFYVYMGYLKGLISILHKGQNER